MDGQEKSTNASIFPVHIKSIPLHMKNWKNMTITNRIKLRITLLKLSKAYVHHFLQPTLGPENMDITISSK